MDIKGEINGFAQSKGKVFLIPFDNREDAERLRSMLQQTKSFNKKNTKYINLETVDHSSTDFVDKTLSSTESNLLEDGKAFLFIFDNYQTLPQLRNLWVQNHLYRWENVKVIILCDTKFFKKHGLDDVFFAPFANEKSQKSLLTIKSCNNKAITIPRKLDSKKAKTSQKETSDSPDLKTHPFNLKNFAGDTTKVAFWADALLRGDEKTQQLQQHYFHLLSATRNSPQLSNLGANAMTVLVRGGVNLSGFNLQDCQLKRSDMKGGYFDSTNFGNTDLSFSELDKAWLRNANLEGAKLDGIVIEDQFNVLHSSDVVALKYLSRRNAMIAVTENEITLWSLSDQTIIKKIQHKTNQYRTYLDADDNDTLFVIGTDTEASAYNIDTMKKTAHIPKQKHPISCLKVSSDGKFIVYGDEGDLEASTTLWDVEKNTKVGKFEAHNNHVCDVAISANNNILVSGGKDGRVYIWDLSKSWVKTIIFLANHVSVYKLFLSEDGSRLITISSDRLLRVWDLNNLPERCSAEASKSSMLKWLTSDANTNTTFIQDAKGEDLPDTCYYEFKNCYISSIAVSKDLNHIAFVDNQADIRVLKITENGVREVANFGTREIPCNLDMSIPGQVLYSDGKEVNSKNYLQKRMVTKQHDSVSSVHLSPGANIVARATYLGDVKCWDFNSGKLTQQLSFMQEGDRVYDIELSESGNELLIAHDQKKASFWHIAEKKPFEFKGFSSAVFCVSMRNDVYAFGSDDYTTCVYNLKTKSKKRYLSNNAIACVSLSSDAKILATGVCGGKIELYDFTSLYPYRTITGYGGIPSGQSAGSILFTRNNKRIVAKSVANKFLVHDIPRSTSRQLTLPENEHWSVCVPESTKVITCPNPYNSMGVETVVRVWDFETMTVLALFDTNIPISALSVDSKRNLIAVGYNIGTTQLWRRNDKTNFNWQLTWSSERYNQSLNVRDCRLSGAKSVAPSVSALLVSKGALFAQRFDAKKKTKMFDKEYEELSGMILKRYKAKDYGHVLRKAAATGNLTIMQNLLMLFDIVNDSGSTSKQTALHIAIEKNQKEAIKILLAFNADILKEDKDKKTSLDYCRQDPGMMKIFVDHILKKHGWNNIENALSHAKNETIKEFLNSYITALENAANQHN